MFIDDKKSTPHESTSVYKGDASFDCDNRIKRKSSNARDKAHADAEFIFFNSGFKINAYFQTTTNEFSSLQLTNIKHSDRRSVLSVHYSICEDVSPHDTVLIDLDSVCDFKSESKMKIKLNQIQDKFSTTK